MPIPFFSSSFKKNSREVRYLSEEMLSFFDQYPYPVLLVNSKNKIVVANPAAAALLSCEVAQMVGTGVEQWGISFKEIKKIAKQQTSEPHLYEVITPRADTILVNMTVTPLAQTKLLMVTLDKQTQTPIGTSFLENCLHAYPMAVTLQDEYGKIILCNRYAEKMLSSTSAQLHGQYIYSFLPKELVASLQRMDETVRQTESFETVPLSYRNAQGEEIFLEVTKTFVSAESGAENMIATVYRDVTAERTATAALEQKTAMLSAILDNIPLGLYARDKNDGLIFYNKSSVKVFNESAQMSEYPHSFQDLQKSHDITKREEQILREGQPCEYPEEEYVDSSGNKRILRLIKIPLKEQGVAPLVLSIVEDVTQMRQQEREMKRMNSILSAIVQNMPIGLYARGETGELLLRNKQCEIIFNVASIALFDKTGTLPHETPEQIQGYMSREHQLLVSRKTLDIPEEEYVTGDGKRKLLHMVKVPVIEGDERFVITLTEDITKRKQQEQELIDSKNFLQTIINNLPVSLSVKGNDGKYILWNKKSEEIFGVPASEVIGQRSYRSDLNKDQLEFLREKEQQIFESHREQEIPQELISSAAEGVKIMHTVHTPVYNETGAPDCLLTVSEDITAKTKMEKQIREANDKNSLLLDHAREAILIVENKKIVYSNNAFFRMLGYESMEEIKGRSLEEFVDKDFHLFLKEKYESALNATAGNAKPISLRLLKKNGQKIEAEFDAVSARYLGRRIVLCFCRDITFDNRMLRELRDDKNTLKAVFEESLLPAFRLQENGYIRVMNRACRELFGFTKEDKNFYCNVYIRPAISLQARKLLKQGKQAEMDYVFDFEKAAEKFPGRINGRGILPLHITFVPINKRDTLAGVEADFVVFVQPTSKVNVNRAQEGEKVSEASLELNSIRRSLPGIYIKIDRSGEVLDICSNLSYWDNAQAQHLQGKSLTDFLKKEIGDTVLSYIKESLSVGISTRFEVPWDIEGKIRYFTMTASPITNKEEVVIWGTDISSSRETDNQLHRVYRLLDESNISLSKQVDKILQFGVSAFHMDIGCILRFDESKDGMESYITQVTQNEQHLEKGMSFKVEECLRNVLDGNVVLFQNLDDCSCQRCIHYKRQWRSLVAAPVYVGDNVVGALCFAAQTVHSQFSAGAEELAGILARWLGIRIELRKTGKMLNAASRSFARTLEYVERPAVMLDLHYNITFVNRPLLEFTGRHGGNMLGRNFFKEVIHDDAFSIKRFKDASDRSADEIFKIHLELYRANGLYEDKEWEVFVCKDAEGKIAGYGLIEVVS